MAKKDLSSLRNKRREDRQRADERFTFRILGVILFLGLWTFLLYFFNWPTAFFILPAGIAVLYLLAYIYPRDFTVLAAYISGGATGLWLLMLLSRRSGRWDTLVHSIFAVVILLSILLFWLLRKKGGTLALGKKTVAIIPRKGRYAFLFTACGIMAASLIATIIIGSSAALYSMIAMFCYLFIIAVYYTVKLI